MPRATIDITQQTRHELKTLEGGFVVVRRMSYGKYLDRQTEALQMQARRQQGENDMEMDLKMAGRKTAVIEFRECIVDHNLEDEDGNKLDLTKPEVLDRLDPRVGQEIGDILDKLNNLELAGN